MASFLRRTAERQPIAILIDDLLRADEPTLALLSCLAREIEGSRALIAAATRPMGDRISTGARRDRRRDGHGP